jgi:hypothetical protein
MDADPNEGRDAIDPHTLQQIDQVPCGDERIEERRVRREEKRGGRGQEGTCL